MTTAYQQIFTVARTRDWNQVRAMAYQFGSTESASTDYIGDIIRDPRGNTLLHVAICQGENLQILEELLHYCNPNSENMSGMTPLSTFFLNQARYDRQNQRDVLRLLLRYGADPMFISETNRDTNRSTYGWTPFAFAVFNKVNNEIFQILKDAGCSFSYVRDFYHKPCGHCD